MPSPSDSAPAPAIRPRACWRTKVLSIHPMTLRMIEMWTRRGDPPDKVRDRALQLINRAFDILEHGFGEDGS